MTMMTQKHKETVVAVMLKACELQRHEIDRDVLNAIYDRLIAAGHLQVQPLPQFPGLTLRLPAGAALHSGGKMKA